MKKWMVEDWQFEVTVIEGKSEKCRLGLEKGDTFIFQYETPADFCPRAMVELYNLCEIIRCGGDFTYRGSNKKYQIEFWCPCHCELFKLIARPINRDENGNYIG